jgi:hypothetical protein
MNELFRSLREADFPKQLTFEGYPFFDSLIQNLRTSNDNFTIDS